MAMAFWHVALPGRVIPASILRRRRRGFFKQGWRNGK
jgi:hypothetical protein